MARWNLFVLHNKKSEKVKNDVIYASFLQQIIDVNQSKRINFSLL